MWHLGTWFSDAPGSARLTVGLHDLEGLFQPKRFYDSVIDEPVMQYGSSSQHFSKLFIAVLGITNQTWKWDFVLRETFPVSYR